MSALARVLRATNNFMVSKDPADYMEWSIAFEQILQEDELDKVGGGARTWPPIMSQSPPGGDPHPCPPLVNM